MHLYIFVHKGPILILKEYIFEPNSYKSVPFEKVPTQWQLLYQNKTFHSETYRESGENDISHSVTIGQRQCQEGLFHCVWKPDQQLNYIQGLTHRN